jgi:hypothetical protein
MKVKKFYVKLQGRYNTVTHGPMSLSKAKRMLENHQGYGDVVEYGRSSPVLIKVK